MRRGGQSQRVKRLPVACRGSEVGGCSEARRWHGAEQVQGRVSLQVQKRTGMADVHILNERVLQERRLSRAALADEIDVPPSPRRGQVEETSGCIAAEVDGADGGLRSVPVIAPEKRRRGSSLVLGKRAVRLAASAYSAALKRHSIVAEIGDGPILQAAPTPAQTAAFVTDTLVITGEVRRRPIGTAREAVAITAPVGEIVGAAHVGAEEIAAAGDGHFCSKA